MPLSREIVQTRYEVKDNATRPLGRIRRTIDGTIAGAGRLGEALKNGIGAGANLAVSGVNRLGGFLTRLDEALDSTFTAVGNVISGFAGLVRGAVGLAADLAPLLSLFAEFTPLGRSLTGNGGVLGKLFTAFTVLRNPLFAAAAGMTFFSAASAAFARDITIAASRTTVAVDELQTLNFQMRQLTAGADLDDLQEALLNISERFGEASRDAGAIRDAMQAIGLSQDEIVQLNFSGPQAQLAAIRLSFQGLATDSERIFRARELFAEDGLRILNFITAEQQELDRLALRNDSLGLVIPEESISRLNSLTKEYKIFGQGAENTAIELGSTFAGVSRESFGLINDLVGLVGGPRGLGAALGALTFPIVAPLEAGLQAGRSLVRLMDTLGEIIADNVVAAVVRARDATRDWLQEVGQRTGIDGFADRLETSLAKVNLQARLSVVQFQLLRRNLPETEIERLVQLEFRLEQGLAGTSKQARILRDELKEEGVAANAASKEFGILIDRLATLNQQFTTELTVESTGLDAIRDQQRVLNEISRGLDSPDISSDEASAGRARLAEAQRNLNRLQQIESESLERRRAEFSASLNDIERIELDATKRREELRTLFSGAGRVESERAEYDRLLQLINSEEQKQIDALRESQTVKVQQAITDDSARVARERDSAQRSIQDLRASFDERFRIELNYRRSLDQLRDQARATGLTNTSELEAALLNRRNLELSSLSSTLMEEERLRRQSQIDAINTDGAQRIAAVDLGSIINFDSTNSRNLQDGLAQIRNIYETELGEIRIAVNLPTEERQQAIAKLTDLRNEAEDTLNVNVRLNTTLDNVQGGLGNTGDILGAVNQIQQVGLDSDRQRLQDRANVITDVRSQLQEAIRNQDQAEINQAKSRLDALTGIQRQEEAAAKRRFEQQKRIQTAVAIVSTISAAVQVFQETKGSLFARIAGMTAALAAGYAQVRAIQSTRFESSSVGSSSGGSGGGSGSGSNQSFTSAQQAAQQQTGTNNRQPSRQVEVLLPEGGLFNSDQIVELHNRLLEENENGTITYRAAS